MMKSRHTFCIASLLVLFSLLSDQLLAEEKAEEQQASKVIECSFLHWGDVPEEKLFFRMGEEYHPIEFKRRERAGKISLKRMADFEVFREVENPVEGELPYEFLASVPVPEHINDALFLIIAAAKDKGGGYRVVTIDDSTTAFPGTAFLFVNLLNKPMTVNFAGGSQDVEPFKTSVMRSKIGPKGGFVPFIVTNGEGKKICENRLYSQFTTRKIVLIGQPREKGGLPEVKFVNQLLAQK